MGRKGKSKQSQKDALSDVDIPDLPTLIPATGTEVEKVRPTLDLGRLKAAKKVTSGTALDASSFHPSDRDSIRFRILSAKATTGLDSWGSSTFSL